MIPYFLLGAALWIATLKSQNDKSVRATAAVCLAMMIFFTGLRYEIGYDWLAYEQYFLWLTPSLSWANYKQSQLVLPVEYLYFVFNVIVKSVGGSLELLLFIISAFNLIVIDRMAKAIDETSRPFVWLLYFCLALVMVQFNILRQSIASSFVIISLLCACRRKYILSPISFAIGLGFHTSIALFFPIFIFINRNIKLRYIIGVLVLSLAVLIAGHIFLANIFGSVGSLLPGGISDKTDLYASGIAGGNVWGISPLAAVLIMLYICMLYIFIRLPQDPYVNVAILLTTAVLIAHLAFGQIPIVWNRVMCVSLPWQLAVLWKHYVRKVEPRVRNVGLVVGGLVGLSVFSFQLTRPENIAFVPYHSLVQVWLFGDQGDGRLRSMYAVQQGQIEQSRAARQ